MRCIPCLHCGTWPDSPSSRLGSIWCLHLIWTSSSHLGVILFPLGTIQKMKIMASCSITWWEIDGETVETVSDFIFGGSKITGDGDYSHEIKRRLLLGRKVMTNLDSILKSRDITLPTKVHLVKAMVFQWSCMDVRVGLWRKLSAEELMLLNSGVGDDSWESLGLEGDQSHGDPTSSF